MSMASESRLTEGREALARQAWEDAYALLSGADAGEELSAADLDALGEAAWAAGHYDDSVRARERAYARHLQEGDKPAAAMVALMLEIDYILRLDMAVASGWQRAAARLIQDTPECAAHGPFAWLIAQGALVFSGDLETTKSQSRETAAIGARLGDLNLQMLGLVTEARALVKEGWVQEGAAMLDEAMTMAVSGNLSVWSSRLIYCNTLCACQEVADYRRAVEWTDVAERPSRGDGTVPTSCHCSVHKAGVLRCRGSWDEAEAEAGFRRDDLEAGDRYHLGMALYEVGEIRLLRGDLEASKEAFMQAHELARRPQPGMALLRLAQGKAEAAMASIAHALADESWDRLTRSNLLFAQVEISLVCGNLEAARAAADELRSIATEFGTQALDASLDYVDGAIRLAEGDCAGALASLRRASHIWQEVGVPYEVARSRMLLGRAYAAEGDDDSAALELRSARTTFARLGAEPAVRRATELLESIGGLDGSSSPSPGPTLTRVFVFTDIVKSTALLEAIGDEAWTEVLRWHDDTLRGILVRHHGEEVHYTGDGFFFAFRDVTPAIECAIAIQRTLAEHRRTHGFAPQVRIGLHAGEASRDRSSYHGKGVHTATRIGAEAQGGEILISHPTLTSNAFRVSDPRTLALRGISQPVKVVSVLWLQ